GKGGFHHGRNLNINVLAEEVIEASCEAHQEALYWSTDEGKSVHYHVHPVHVEAYLTRGNPGCLDVEQLSTVQVHFQAPVRIYRSSLMRCIQSDHRKRCLVEHRPDPIAIT